MSHPYLTRAVLSSEARCRAVDPELVYLSQVHMPIVLIGGYTTGFRRAEPGQERVSCLTN